MGAFFLLMATVNGDIMHSTLSRLWAATCEHTLEYDYSSSNRSGLTSYLRYF